MSLFLLIFSDACFGRTPHVAISSETPIVNGLNSCMINMPLNVVTEQFAVNQLYYT